MTSPSSVNLMALLTRLVKTCLVRNASPPDNAAHRHRRTPPAVNLSLPPVAIAYPPHRRYWHTGQIHDYLVPVCRLQS